MISEDSLNSIELQLPHTTISDMVGKVTNAQQFPLDYDFVAGSLAIFLCVFIATAMTQTPKLFRGDKPTRREIKIRLGKTKVVRFPDEACYEDQEFVSLIPTGISIHSEMDDDKPNRFWWRQKDFRRFKESSDAEIQVAGNGHPTPLSYTKTIMRIFQACLLAQSDNIEDVISDTARTELIHWMNVGTLRIGMEKTTVRSMAKGCFTLRQQATETVLDAQFNCNGDPEAIRQRCLRVTRPTRLFATIIAQSLAESCAQEIEDGGGYNGFVVAKR